MNVPSRSWFDPVLGSWLHTGEDAVEWGLRFKGGPLATDIETPGLDRAFEINCVTMAWREGEHVHSILLDPRRNPTHADVAAVMYAQATRIILHNAPYDAPGLYHAGMLGLDGVDRITDTLVLARLAYPDRLIRKSLGDLAVTHLGWEEFKGGMDLAFKAAGFRTKDAGYEGMDIDSPVYRMGAMADTVGTLLIEPVLRQKCRDLTLNHPFRVHGCTTLDDADRVIRTQEVVHRVMLRRTAVGLNVDRDYLDSYLNRVHDDRQRHMAALASAGLEGGNGKSAALITYLHDRGELPSGWPRTSTGRLRATKADLEKLAQLDHPLAAAQRSLAETDKVINYLEKVAHQATVTGRCHPQVGTLGASQTGRTSYSQPELQQFPAAARPIIVADDPNTVWSVDFAQIEPVVMGLMARDTEFLEPFEAGGDLYEPLMRAAGIDRKTSKTVLLATMYGQGVSAMAGRIGHTIESAAQIRRQILEAMPRCGPWMRRVQSIAEDMNLVLTAGGRILPCAPDWSNKAVNWTVQSSAYDVLAHAICALEGAGLGDSIMISMHDELVVEGDESLARDVQKIMEAPPQFLIDRAGRVPVLRTDCATTGKAWGSV